MFVLTPTRVIFRRAYEANSSNSQASKKPTYRRLPLSPVSALSTPHIPLLPPQVALAVPPSMLAIGLKVTPVTVDLVLETHTARCADSLTTLPSPPSTGVRTFRARTQ